MKNITLFVLFALFAVTGTAQQPGVYRIDKIVEENGRGNSQTEYQIHGEVTFRGDSVTVNIPELRLNDTFKAANYSFERDENGQAARYEIGIYCQPEMMVAVEKRVGVSYNGDEVFVRQWGRMIYLKDPAPK